VKLEQYLKDKQAFILSKQVLRSGFIGANVEEGVAA
jgi:hypothetical protein